MQILNPNPIQTTNPYPLAYRGGGGGGGGNNAFSEFCRYILKFVGTCKPTRMSFVPTKIVKYQTKYWKKWQF